jgi:opacity protein-like surface antigen
MEGVVRGLVVLACALLFAPAARADGVEGQGRLSVSGGWRLTPNRYFTDHAARGGHPLVSDSHGGPQGVASFGYGATANLEVNIELLVGAESITLQGLDPVSTVTYGGLISGRLYLLPDSVVRPWLQVSTGPLLVYVTGAGASEPNEQLKQGFAVGAGLNIPLSGAWSLVAEYRLLFVRGNVSGVPNAAGINGGGSWFGLGIGYAFGRTPDPMDSLR